jgi:hypothetical protein
MRQGLSDDFVRSLFGDREGNIWIGTNQIGVCRFSGEQIVSFTRFQGAPDREIIKVFDSADGRVYATSSGYGIYEVGAEENSIVPGSARPPFQNLDYRITRDLQGHWWTASNEGVMRFRGPRLDLSDKARLPPGTSNGEIPSRSPAIRQPSIWVGAIILPDDAAGFVPTTSQRRAVPGADGIQDSSASLGTSGSPDSTDGLHAERRLSR